MFSLSSSFLVDFPDFKYARNRRRRRRVGPHSLTHIALRVRHRIIDVFPGLIDAPSPTLARNGTDRFRSASLVHLFAHIPCCNTSHQLRTPGLRPSSVSAALALARSRSSPFFQEVDSSNAGGGGEGAGAGESIRRGDTRDGGKHSSGGTARGPPFDYSRHRKHTARQKAGKPDRLELPSSRETSFSNSSSRRTSSKHSATRRDSAPTLYVHLLFYEQKPNQFFCRYSSEQQCNYICKRSR